MTMVVSADSPLWLAARHLLKERVHDFFRRRKKVTGRWEAEDIHDLRVASRRLRESLALFAPCYPPAPLRRLEKKVKKVTRLLGEIRDSDEAGLFFADLADKLKGEDRDQVVRLKLSLEDQRREALQELAAQLPKIIPDGLRERYLKFAASPRLFDPSLPIDRFQLLAPFARHALRERLVPILDLLPEASREEAEGPQHQLRIAIKHFRYRFELLGPLFGAGYEERHQTLKNYQDLLGRLHDLCVFRDLVLRKFHESSRIRVAAVVDARRRESFKSFTRLPVDKFFRKLTDEVDAL